MKEEIRAYAANQGVLPPGIVSYQTHSNACYTVDTIVHSQEHASRGR